jgi:hypothetical protein
MKAYGGRPIAPSFMTSALDIGEWSASRTGRFTTGEDSRYPLDGRLGGPQNRSGCYGEEKNIAPAGNSTPTVQPVARRYCTCIPTELSRHLPNSVSAPASYMDNVWSAYNTSGRIYERKDNLENLGEDGSMVLKFIIKK